MIKKFSLKYDFQMFKDFVASTNDYQKRSISFEPCDDDENDEIAVVEVVGE